MILHGSTSGWALLKFFSGINDYWTFRCLLLVYKFVDNTETFNER